MADEETKQKMGRPTKYKEEYCDITPFLKHCEKKNELVSICGYAVYLDVVENTLYNWGKENPNFLRSLDKITQIEKQMLQNKGLNGTYNSTIAKLLLSANHGMAERKDYTSGGKPLKAPSLIVEMPADIDD